MHVRDEQTQVDRLRTELLFQSHAERADAGAGIEHDDFIVGPKLDAGGVAPITERGSPGDRNRTAHAPKFQARRQMQKMLP